MRAVSSSLIAVGIAPSSTPASGPAVAAWGALSLDGAEASRGLAASTVSAPAAPAEPCEEEALPHAPSARTNTTAAKPLMGRSSKVRERNEVDVKDLLERL